MLHSVYILFSQKIKLFYIDYTNTSVDERLKKHNTNHKGFTGRTHDWKIIYFETYQNKTNALKKEKEIKSGKANIKLFN